MRLQKSELWLLVLSCSFLLVTAGCRGAAPENDKYTRPAVFAGKFYPAAPDQLKRKITGYLGRARNQQLKGRLIGLIVPHAGYRYSGPVSGWAYRQLKDRSYKTVILLGPSHRKRFSGISVWPRGRWETPLGSVQVDSEMARRLLRADTAIEFVKTAHSREHSLEVQLPFLQQTLDQFKIVPVVSGQGTKLSQKLATVLTEIIRSEDVLLLISTDMSHYLPYEQAKKIDQKTLRTLEKLSVKKLDRWAEKTLRQGRGGIFCGLRGVLTAVRLARLLGSVEAVPLRYANSGDIVGKRKKVVGYGAVALVDKNGKPKKRGSAVAGRGWLNQTEQKRMLALARSTLRAWLAHNQRPEVTIQKEKLNEKRGVFVTLRRKDNGQLRGCIGEMRARRPLWKAVREMAIKATRDPRFRSNPVTAEELSELKIEISVLTPMKQVDSAARVKPGRDGVMVIRGGNRGVYLPQVAEETGWNKREFLAHLCHSKAGLEIKCWKNPATKIYTFQAQVFSE